MTKPYALGPWRLDSAFDTLTTIRNADNEVVAYVIQPERETYDERGDRKRTTAEDLVLLKNAALMMQHLKKIEWLLSASSWLGAEPIAADIRSLISQIEGEAA
jgi:hypothetical protein